MTAHRSLFFIAVLALVGHLGCREDKPESCPLECPDNAQSCAGQTFPQSPDCQDICYEGKCCDYRDGEWSTVFVDCERPRPSDAGPPDATTLDASSSDAASADARAVDAMN